ncbi:MAG: ornithine cyclodeaminase family protein [Actinomycetota bacterium]
MITTVAADQVDAGLPWPRLIDALGAAFATPEAVTVPLRHHHPMAPERHDGPTLLLMPAWSQAYAGVKIVGVFPSNRAKGIPTVRGSYLLMGGDDGRPLALIDGAQLTVRRTAAASVLAATHLARPASSHLLLVGSGRVAAAAAEAYAARFPIDRVTVWNHRRAGADDLAARLRTGGMDAVAADTDALGPAVAGADIVCCATLTVAPLIDGRLLTPGTHLDLIGAFTPAMRESDDECIRRSSVYVDSMEGATAEGGDIVQPLESGVLDRADIVGDLFGLCAGTAPGRHDDEQITLFKSVGHALEDLAAAVTLLEDGEGAPDPTPDL